MNAMGEIILTYRGMGGSTIPLEADPIVPALFRDTYDLVAMNKKLMIKVAG